MNPNDVKFNNGTIEDVIRVDPVNNDYDEKYLTSQLVEFAGGNIFDDIELRTIKGVILGVRELYTASEEDQPIKVKLTKAGDWSYEQFMSFHKIVSFFCSETSENCIRNDTKTINETLRAKIDANYSFELMNRFEEAFTEFKKSVENKVSRKRFRPIKITGNDPCKPIEISSHKYLAIILMNILDSSFESLFPDVNLAFVPRPGGVDEHGDLYYETRKNNKVTSSKCVAEIKTRNKIEFNVRDVIEEVKRRESFLCKTIYETAGQLLDTKEVPKAMLLTCHEYSYFLYTEDESRIIQISPIIRREDFFQAVFLVLSLSCAPISQELDFNLDRFKAEFTNQNESIQPRNITQLKLNDDEYCSELFTAQDFIKARKDRTFLGCGSCGNVFRFDLNGRSYVDKSCSIFKSKEGVLDQLRNEFEILMRLNSKVQSDKFFPSVYFYGSTFVTMHIVMDFIEGHRIEEFNDKSVTLEVKEKCVKRVEELHAIRLLHGDLRASNFILTSSGVFIIDFGLSRFVGPDEEKELEFEMTRFRRLLNV